MSILNFFSNILTFLQEFLSSKKEGKVIPFPKPLEGVYSNLNKKFTIEPIRDSEHHSEALKVLSDLMDESEDKMNTEFKRYFKDLVKVIKDYENTLIEAPEEPRRDVMRGASLRVKNESERLKKELKQLRVDNRELLDLILDLADWIKEEFDKNTVITMIYRTQEEQDSLYKDNDKYKKKPFKSPHQFWHAIDLRTSIYSEEEIEKVVKYLNNKHDKSNYYNWTAKAHAIKGNVLHFHIQYVKA